MIENNYFNNKVSLVLKIAALVIFHRHECVESNVIIMIKNDYGNIGTVQLCEIRKCNNLQTFIICTKGWNVNNENRG